MVDVTLVKNAGLDSALQIISCRAEFEYPAEADGASANFGPAQNELAIHLTGSPNTAAADAILAAIELPTCTASLLDITVNVGTYLVNDVTSVVADADDAKYFLVTVAINVTTGVLEVYVRTTTDEPIPGEERLDIYPDLPLGVKECCNLKEYALDAGGTTLLEIADYIE